MIDLTPLDVRKKRGDFSKLLRGYDPNEVDSFLELVAERLETLVKENLTLQERSARLGDQVESSVGRERAVQEALVTAQELREDILNQARREAELLRKEAESDAEQIRRTVEMEMEDLRRSARAEIERVVGEATNRVEELRLSMVELDRRRGRFLRDFRGLLEREMADVEVEEARAPLEADALQIDVAEAIGSSSVAADPSDRFEAPRDDGDRLEAGADGAQTYDKELPEAGSADEAQAFDEDRSDVGSPDEAQAFDEDRLDVGSAGVATGANDDDRGEVGSEEATTQAYDDVELTAPTDIARLAPDGPDGLDVGRGADSPDAADAANDALLDGAAAQENAGEGLGEPADGAEDPGWVSTLAYGDDRDGSDDPSPARGG